MLYAEAVSSVTRRIKDLLSAHFLLNTGKYSQVPFLVW